MNWTRTAGPLGNSSAPSFLYPAANCGVRKITPDRAGGAMMKYKITVLSALVLTVLRLAPVHASGHMRITRCEGAQNWKACAYIVINGEIQPTDGDEFLTRTKEIASAVVYLNSEGGNMLSSLEIGERVHEAGYVTLVPNHGVCNSGCAMIWLAGSNLSLGYDAHVIWHVPASPRDPRHADGTGSAMVGMYLAKLGYGYDTVVRLFGHDPQALHAIARGSEGQVTEGDFTAPLP